MHPSITSGNPYPLGAVPDARGTNFALFSAHAEAVTLCLFETAAAPAPAVEVQLAARTGDVFHAHLGGVRAGQAYAYRISGPWAPEQGHRFNSRKLLLDPYARAIARPAAWDPAVYPYVAVDYPDPSVAKQIASPLDSSSSAPLGLVAEPDQRPPDWRRPRTPWRDTVLYELHLRGFTKLHPAVPPELRGTFAGLASEPAVDYLQRLGVTAVELLPVQHHVDDHRLERLGLTNYWGYQPLAYFAPEPSYARSRGLGAIREFRDMVLRLHRAGIEVILDVVYNHTGEAGADGPLLAFRGIDNASYYRLAREDRRRYIDYTGCGNTLNTHHPAVVRLVLDSLRYWAEQMGVDGFRFDLAATLGRTQRDFDLYAPLLTAIRQDPVLQGLKLIAEPWDLHAPDSDQLGGFPAEWAEWNRCFRDDVRRFWRGDPGQAPALATRLAGSSDIFGPRRRPPQAGINFVTAHDGFTLRDLVSYTAKRNQANGEGNRDGEGRNWSWNCGAEGPSTEASVLRRRARQQRNVLATLLLAQGVPMLVAGDEFGRTQRGNNNAYCQDNALSWVDWHLAEGSALAAFVRHLLSLRRAEAGLRRTAFFTGRRDPATGTKDVMWLASNGRELDSRDWTEPGLACFGELIAASDRVRLLLLCNASDRTVRFSLPDGGWELALDTAAAEAAPQRLVSLSYRLESQSLALLRSAP